MGQIALRDYLNQITDLIYESRLDEAVAHCRNILEQHPRHVETYQLLGRALLELQSYNDAADIFQRVLSADPENVISHAGLAMAYSESDDLQRATWHMERAFDFDPYNRTILAELSEFYARRDGEAPDQIDMTRAALACLYLRGSLYRLAADEFSTLLSEQPDRIDFQVMLAETLYRDQKPKAAARVALKVVDKLPLCIKANAILAGVWLASGRPDQAQQHLLRVRSLTLPRISSLGEDTLVAEVLSKVDQKQLPKQVLIEEIDYVPVAGVGYGDGIERRSSLDADKDDSQEMPDWLREFSQPSEDRKPDDMGSIASTEHREQRDLSIGGHSDDPSDQGGGINSFDSKDVVAGDDTMLPGGTNDEPLMDAPNGGSGETSSEANPNWLSHADNLVDFRQWKTMMAGTLVASSGQVQSIHGEVVTQEEEFPTALQEEAILLNISSEQDDATPSGEELPSARNSEDEMLIRAEEAELLDEMSEDMSDAIDPPDWLYDAVGLGNHSKTTVSGDDVDLAEDITREGGDTEELSAEAVFPDWLSGIINIDEEPPLLDKEAGSIDDTNMVRSVAPSSVAGYDSASKNDMKVVHKKKDFSNQLGEANKSTEDAMNGALEDPGFNQDDEGDDLDGELKWLEELAASQNASEDALSGSGSDLDSLGDLPDEDFIPDWLKADVFDAAVNEDPLPANAADNEEVDFPDLPQEAQTIPSQEIPDWLREQMVTETLTKEEDATDDVDWFNQIIAGDESAIDELLEVQGMNLISESGAPAAESTEDQPSWLLELEKLDSPTEDTPVSESIVEVDLASSGEPEIEERQPVESTEALDETEFYAPDEVPSDPEEAMAWLEQLALEQGLAEEELADEVSDLVPEEFMEAAFDLEGEGILEESGDLTAEVPEDPDEAMAWLERLAVEQGASEDELTTFAIDAGTKTVAELTPEKDDEFPEMALSDLADVTMPTDQEEALFWLEELVVGIDPEPLADGAIENGLTDQVEEIIAEIEPEDMQIESERPADLEADQFAAMTSDVTDVIEEDLDAGAELESIDDAVSETLIAAVIDSEEAEEPAVIESIEVEPEAETDEEDDDLAWLDSLDEANVTGWLRAEEALLAEEQAPSADLAQPQINIVPDPVIETSDEHSVPDQVAEEQQYDDHDLPELSVAQSALQTGQLAEALDAYSALVDSGESLPYVIADLEGAVETYGDQPGFMKLLGDAYSRNGQLQKAIEIYRLALNNL